MEADKRVVLYTRFSPPGSRPREEIHSLEVQQEALLRYCDFNKLEVAQVFKDPTTSATIPLAKRAGGQKMVNFIKKHRIRHVASARVCRLFRDVTDGRRWIDYWERKGVCLHLCEQGGVHLSSGSKLGKFLLTQVLMFAEFEQAIVSERTQKGMQHNRASGLRQSRHLPYGWKYDWNSPLGKGKNPKPKGMLICEEEQEVLQMIDGWFNAGNNYNQILRLLNEEGISKRGKPWYYNGLKDAHQAWLRDQAIQQGVPVG